MLAASYGTQLLEDNKQLKQRIDTLLATEKKYADAAVENAALQSKLSKTEARATEQIQELESRFSVLERSSREKARDLELQERAAIKASHGMELQLNSVTRERDELSLQLQELHAGLAECRHKYERASAEVKVIGNEKQQISEELNRLRGIEAIAEADRLRLNGDLEEVLALHGALQERLGDYEELAAEVAELRQENQKLISHVQELDVALLASRSTMQILQEKLQHHFPHHVLPAPSSDDLPDKSLFSEVEDRRIQLESQHESLRTQHESLMKTHFVTKNHRERLKNQVAMLAQFANNRSDELRVKRLEQLIFQTQNEKRELQNRLQCKESFEDAGFFRTFLFQEFNFGTTGSGGLQAACTEEMIEYLRVRLCELNEDNKRLRRENRTKQMVRLNETERMLSLESQLNKRDAEIQLLKRQMMSLRIKLDSGQLDLTPSDPSDPSVIESVENTNISDRTSSVEDTETEKALAQIPNTQLPFSDPQTSTGEATLSMKSGYEEQTDENKMTLSNGQPEPAPKEIVITRQSAKSQQECRQQ